MYISLPLPRQHMFPSIFALAGLLQISNAGATDFMVTRADDPAPGSCLVATDCSLRSAIIASNMSPGPDTIILPAGDYNLEIPGQAEDASLTGDMDILGDLTIQGAGSTTTKVFPRDLDSAFDVARGVSVRIIGLSILNTVANGGDRGGGVNSGFIGAGDQAQTLLYLSDVAIDNTRNFYNSAIRARGRLHATALRLEHTMSVHLQALNFSGSEIRIARSQFIDNAEGAWIELPAGGQAFMHDVRVVNGANPTYCGGIALLGSGSAVFDRLTLENIDSLMFGALCTSGSTTATIRDSMVNPKSGVGLYMQDTSGINVENSTIWGDNQTGAVMMQPGNAVNFKNSTVSTIAGLGGGVVNFTNSILAHGCAGPVTVTRAGRNIESPGNSCSLDPGVDFVSVSTAALNLGALGNNGGPTKTRLPLAGSVAIGGSSGAGVAFCPLRDQRGYLRAPVCDLGSAESAGINDTLFADGFEF